MRRLTVLLAAGVLMFAACGGSPAGNGATSTSGPDGNPPQSTPGGGGGGGSADMIRYQDIQAAFAALEAQGSWEFEAEVFAASSAGSLTVTGTERRQPERAVDAIHLTDDGPFAYVRIGDTIWFDAGVGQWTEADASSRNLISQYEPYHLAGLVDLAVTSINNDFELVGEEQVNGVATRHYRLTEADRAQVTERLGLSPDAFAGDVWIATSGGYLVKFAHGPQSLDDMQLIGGIGFTVDVTSIGCSCPVEPPA